METYMLKKKSILVLLVLIFILFGNSSNLNAQENSKFIEYELYPVAKNVIVRDNPDFTYEKNDEVILKPSKTVTVIDCSENKSSWYDQKIKKTIWSKWAKIKDGNGKTGWVFAYLLRDSNVKRSKSNNNRTLSNNFYKNLPPDFVVPCDFIERTVLMQYGAVFVSKGGALPNNVLFENNNDVEEWQKEKSSEPILLPTKPQGDCNRNITKVKVILQLKALTALKNARRKNNKIMPRCYADSSIRSFDDTVINWKRRVIANDRYTDYRGKGLDCWTKNGGCLLRFNLKTGGLDKSEVERVQGINNTYLQIREILKIEKERKGCLSTGKSSSILYSSAPPGMSQHHSLLAIDIYYKNLTTEQMKEVRKWLNVNGWFETVYLDTFHFTYLGFEVTDTNNFRKEIDTKMKSLGLKEKGNYWIPKDSQTFRCKPRS